MDEKTARPFWQFGLRSLLWLTLCIAIGLGAYRQGFENGYADRSNQRQEVGRLFTVTYDVKDVVPMERIPPGVTVDFDALMDDLCENVLPRTWDQDKASMAEFATTLSIVVSHDKEGHERIAAYLEQLRKKNKNQRLAIEAEIKGENEARARQAKEEEKHERLAAAKSKP